MKSSSQRGSAIFMLFIAVALFGLLAYAFLQGSRSNIAMITDEAGKASGYQSQDCTNAVNMAVRRLSARGCDGIVSYEIDGSNPNAGAPTDGSCSIYHPNGGGVQNCRNMAAPNCTLGSLALGDVCGDTIYAGISGGSRLYISSTVIAASTYNNGSNVYTTTNAINTSNGRINTNLLLALTDGNQPYHAAESCNSLGAEWYLPAIEELEDINTNKSIGNIASTLAAIISANIDDDFFSSSESGASTARAYDFSSGHVRNFTTKNGQKNILCTRRD